MTIVEKNNNMHIWCEPYSTPVVEAERGSGAISISIVSGSHSIEEAYEIASAISKAIRFAEKEEPGDEAQGD